MSDSRRILALTAALVFGCSALAASYPASAERFMANTYRINDERAPESILSVVEACADDNGCPPVAKTFAAYLDLGISLVSRFSYDFHYTHNEESHETRVKFYIPTGYVLCEFYLPEKSYTGKGYVAVTGYPEAVDVYIWLRPDRDFEQNYFVEATITIISVEQSYLWQAIREDTCGSLTIRRRSFSIDGQSLRHS